MKNCIPAILLFCTVTANAQRPATKAETEEDARVLSILSASMPHDIEGWTDEGERSNGESNLKGVSGFYNNTNFATRDIFQHQYTISYRLVNPSNELKNKLDNAKAKNDFAYILSASTCEINILVNGNNDQIHANSNFKKINLACCPNVYRDAANSEYTVFYFGKNWVVNSVAETSDDGRGTVEKQYYLRPVLKNSIGTVVQSIMVVMNCNADVADMMIQKIDWAKINNLIGTGAFTDNTDASELKKYFAEKPVPAVPGKNVISFTMIAADGTSKDVVISASKNDFSNSACLRNHNENPKVLQEAHIDFHISDEKDGNLLFMMSLPIIRTTGTVTATYDSDYDYQIMWRGNTDVNHSFSPESIVVTLTKWAPVGDFIEGTFSGTATLKDHNDFSTDVPKYTIKNGKFRLRRIADEMR